MQEYRKELPMWKAKQDVVNIVDREQVVIICGETGWYAHPHPSYKASTDLRQR